MAKHPRLTKRKGSNNYYFRAKIPADLLEHFGKNEVTFSLRTPDYKAALKLCRIESLKFDQQCEEARRTVYSVEIQELPQIEIERIAAIAYQCEMEEAEEKRASGLSDKAHTDYSELLQTLDFEFSERLAKGETQEVETYADELLASQGIKLDKNSHDYKILLVRLLESFAKANQDKRKRQRGQIVSPVPIPAPQPTRSKAELLTLEEAVEKYIDFKTNGPKPWASSSQKDIPPQVRQFPQIIGKDKFIGDLCRDDMRLYWDSMLKLPSRRTSHPYRNKSLKQLLRMNIPKDEQLSPKTLDTRFTNIKTFLNWCEDEGCIGKARPLNKVLIAPEPEPTAAKRTIFDDSDLKNLFHPDRYGQGKLFTKPWHYWMPLLALFTGARVEELSQLHTDDIKQIGKVWVLDINEIGDKRVKTRAGKRRVPIHPFLINDLRFLDFVTAMRKEDGDQIFKDLPFNERTGKRSDKVSKWFTRYRRACGVGAMAGVSSLTFHSFRHTMITWCKHHDINRDKYKEVVGHERGEVRDVTSGYEAAQLVEKLLSEVIEPIDFHVTIPLTYLKNIN